VHVVDRKTLVSGFSQVLARFSAVVKGKEPEPAFHALFEALSWAVSIDELLKFPSQVELRGLRFARHRVHHQWADALRLDEGGFSFPMTFPLVFFEWRWRLATELPKGRDDRGREEYETHLAGRPARVTLRAVDEYLRGLISASQ
jgi:hypothetical protein